jgi:hypothetical protein
MLKGMWMVWSRRSRRAAFVTAAVVASAGIASAALANVLPRSSSKVAARHGGRPSMQSAKPAQRRVSTSEKPLWTKPAHPASVVGEVSSGRSEFSRVFRLSNGSLRVDTSPSPLFYQADGSWQPIDNTLRRGGPGLVTAGNTWTVALGQARAGMTLSWGGSAVTLAPTSSGRVAPRTVTPAVVSNPKRSASAAASDPTLSPIPQKSVAAWRQVWTGVDLRVVVSSSGVADDVVLTGPSSPSNVGFKVSGASVVQDLDGSLSLSGPLAGRFVIPPPRVTTAGGEDVTGSAGAAYQLGPDGELVVGVSPSWLSSLPAGSFPVTIDPDFTEQNPSGTVSLSNPATGCGTFSYTAEIQIGVSGSCTWRAAAAVGGTLDLSNNTLDSYANKGYRAYDSILTLNPASGGNETGYDSSCGSSLSGCTSTTINIFGQGTKPTSESQVGSGSGACTSGTPFAQASDPTVLNGNATLISPFVYTEVDCWLTHNLTSQWMGFTESPVGSGATPLRDYELWFATYLEFPPPPSRVVSVARNAVLTSTQPTLQASPVTLSAAQCADSMFPTYNYEVTTGPTPNSGLVVSSGEMEDTNVCPTSGTDVPPSWTVPAGALQEGVSYHAWVLTDWNANGTGFYRGDGVPQTVPPLSWGVPFTIKLGLGAGGAMATDSVGSVPGQSSTPSTGAPSPGLPGSKLTVNMVDGNASLSVGTPTLPTVGGGLALSFTYNSLPVTGTSSPGLEGYYYDTVKGQQVLVAQRVDSTVEFPPGTNWQPSAQVGSPGTTVWTGTITLPTTGGISSGDSVELGEISSDGMTIALGTNSSYLVDSGPHAAQTGPVFGPAVTDTGQAQSLSITWTHSDGNPPAAQLYLDDVTSGSVWSVSPS